MNLFPVSNLHPSDNQLIEDTRQARRLLDRMTTSLRDAEEQASNLTGLMLRIERGTLLARPSKRGRRE